MAVENVALMHECSPKHLHMRLAQVELAQKNVVLTAKLYIGPTVPTGLLVPKAVDELHNLHL